MQLFKSHMVKGASMEKHVTKMTISFNKLAELNVQMNVKLSADNSSWNFNVKCEKFVFQSKKDCPVPETPIMKL